MPPNKCVLLKITQPILGWGFCLNIMWKHEGFFWVPQTRLNRWVNNKCNCMLKMPLPVQIGVCSSILWGLPCCEPLWQGCEVPQRCPRQFLPCGHHQHSRIPGHWNWWRHAEIQNNFFISNFKTFSHQAYRSVRAFTVNSEFFSRILFSRKALKTFLHHLKFATMAWFTYFSKRQWFHHFTRVLFSDMRSFA